MMQLHMKVPNSMVFKISLPLKIELFITCRNALTLKYSMVFVMVFKFDSFKNFYSTEKGIIHKLQECINFEI